MRSLLRICSSVFLIVSLFTLGYADEHFPFLAKVSKGSVNVRAGANTNFEKIDKLNQGDEIVVLAKTFDWYKVQLPLDAKSYVRADYLKIRSNSIAEVIGDKVNIRAIPNSESTSLGLLIKGTLVKVKEQINGWWQIEPPLQAVGWIRQDFLSIKSLSVEPALIRGPVVLPEEAPVTPVKNEPSSLATIEIRGRLMPLDDPKVDIHYELVVDGQVIYYVQSVPNLDRFKGAVVFIKGLVLTNQHQYIYPVLRVITISLLLHDH